ncbi:MAG: hypothetical protein AAGJ35_12345 [Myxococcota bacterium]
MDEADTFASLGLGIFWEERALDDVVEVVFSDFELDVGLAVSLATLRCSFRRWVTPCPASALVLDAVGERG